MSQRELAEGICKQGQISRLENGEFTPGADFLYALSKKLAQTFITNRNYESLKYI